MTEAVRERVPATAPSRIETVIRAIEDRIEARALGPGARLPSVRGLAESMGVSKSTVVEAYDRLAARGAIVSRPGSGFFVSARPEPFRLAAIGPRLDRAVDPVWITRQSLEAGPDSLKPGCGWLPPEWLPEEELRRALRHVARQSRAVMSYDTPQGHAPLRQQLALRLTERGIRAHPDQLVLTDSTTQALDLVIRFLAEPGDTVLLDDPCYFSFQALARAHRLRMVGVPFGGEGPDLAAFERALIEHKPRFYITNSGLQNPTGATPSPVVVHRMLRLAEMHGTLIVEDDAYADFETEPAPRLAGFDGLDRVIHVGGFSKTLSTGARIGVIAIRPDWVERLVDLKLAVCLSDNHLTAATIHRFLAEGSYRHHLDALRTRLSDVRGTVVQRLRQAGLSVPFVPSAGMFLWTCLPEGLDAADVSRRALARGVVLAPGNVFSIGQGAAGFLRFNVAQCTNPRVFTELSRAMEG
ncbi:MULTISPECIES: PLP-dependent aminotransferase family protein [Methylobacterium]|uniref:8-amino-7-oxononanoate synthase n=3 Tax=Pseudomonadota TaxID=1224 RepID=A0ABQ4STJ2_9HYPH|nr:MULTISPECIES: PLP-dependent aminotransferase family protein [Methylobacterium]PIU05723.1 MAG: GntR family transcriptional regulator [Methylobacterium sp. CG09_land_8_20_14_0_10_71_15]PIU15264.1 MAG: GntR family transcriptional regulator [Methylobacterium sp. CG08_land_8_20_14_0_20_71_15]GBU19804.1 transcriptional regulator [Methylobacterium sp.]GJE06539.1 Histidinol-phosphate aminotransferase [Methylobacterium jeotgali]